MDKQIAIKSDKKSLEALRESVKENYLNQEREKREETNKNFKHCLFYVLLFTFFSFLNPPFKIILYFFIVLTVPYLIYYSVKKYKDGKVIKSIDKGWEKFTDMYNGLDYVYYNLYDDKLEYHGHDKYI